MNRPGSKEYLGFRFSFRSIPGLADQEHVQELSIVTSSLQQVKVNSGLWPDSIATLFLCLRLSASGDEVYVHSSCRSHFLFVKFHDPYVFGRYRDRSNLVGHSLRQTQKE